MATAAQVIKAALQRILVQDSEAPLEPDEFQDSIFAMNNFMLDLDAQGVKLGYTEINNLGETVTIPVGALRGLITNLAIEMAPDFDVQVSGTLAQIANDGLKAMRRLGVRMQRSRYPGTLPIGSGNEGDSVGFRSDHFYDDQEALILSETTGPIAVETATTATTTTTT